MTRRKKRSSTSLVNDLVEQRFGKPVCQDMVRLGDFADHAHRLVFAILFRDKDSKKLSCIFDIAGVTYEHRSKRVKTGLFVINRGVHNLIEEGVYKYWFIETDTQLVAVKPTGTDQLYDKLNVTITREDDHTVTREIDYVGHKT